MTDREYVLQTMRRHGLDAAKELQVASVDMTGTELYEKGDYIPDFLKAVAVKNMLERKAGQKDGFLCKSSAGHIVRLIQNYDSTTYTQEPEELPAQWGWYWSTDPKKALPFVESATSPYNIGDCCIYPIDPAAEQPEIHVWQSEQDNNTWAPGTINIKWTDLGTLEEVMNGVSQDPDAGDEEDTEPPIEEVITAERGMEYVYGKKYLDPEDNNTYICKRTGEAEGGKVVLQFLPHELIGQYFELSN